MPRSSRHRSSHKQHRRRERLDSDSEGYRDSKGSASGKREVVSFIGSPDEKNSLEGKRGGKNVDLLVVVERWNDDDGEGGEEDEEKKDGIERFHGIGDKMDKDRGGRKREGSGGDKDELVKRRLEKDSKRSERSGDDNGVEVRRRERERSLEKGKECLVEKRRDYDVKKYSERELEKAKERGSEREHWQDGDRERRVKRGQEEIESRRDRRLDSEAWEKTSDGLSIKTGSRVSGGEKKMKGSVENGDRQEITEFHNFDLDKDISKRSRRKDYSGDNDKFYDDNRDSYNRRLVSTDDHARNGSYKIEKYKEERYKEKSQGDFDRDERHPRHDKHQDVRSARDQTGNQSENKDCRDETKPSENCSKRVRVQDNECESSPYVDECSMSHRDNRYKKRFFDNNDLCSDMKPQSIMESQSLVNSMLDSHITELNDCKVKTEKSNIKGGADSTQAVQSSPFNSQVVKNGFSLKMVDAAQRKSEEKREKHSIPRKDLARPLIRHIDSESSGVLESHSMEKKSTPKGHPFDDFQENSAASQNPTNQWSDCQTSPRHISEKPSSSSGRRYSNRGSASPYIDSEEMKQKTSYSRDGRGYSLIEKRQDFSWGKQEGANCYSQMDLPVSDSFPVGSLPYKRTDYLSNSSASPHHRPSSLVRHGMDNPASGSDGDKFQAGDRKPNNRHRRIVDPNYGRGHANSMKGVLNCWPSSVSNGFIPFHNGPPPGGFYPIPQPFPVPPMYGVRPPMDLNQHCSPFHMNESSDGFSGHGRPFGLWNRVEDPFPPNLQGWDGNNIFSDGSYVQCRSDWETKNHLLNNPGSDMNVDSLKELNGNSSRNFHASEKEMENVSCLQGSGEHTKSAFIEVNGSKDFQTKKNTKGILFKILQEPSKLSDANIGLSSIIFSNLDISFDLAGPELYKQWTKKVGLKGNISLYCQADKPPEGLDCKKEPLSMPIHNKTLRFPTLPTDTFQEAMSLYKKDGVSKAKILSSIIKIKEEMDPPECSNALKVDCNEKVSPLLNLLEIVDPFSNIEEDNSINSVETNIDDMASRKQSDAVKNSSPNIDVLGKDSSSDIMNEDANVGTFQVASPKPSDVEEIDCIGNPPNVNLLEIDSPSDKFDDNSDKMVSPKQSNGNETENVGNHCTDVFKSPVNDNPPDDMVEDDDAGNLCTLEVSNVGYEVKENNPVVMHSSPNIKIGEPGVGVCSNEYALIEIDPTDDVEKDQYSLGSIKGHEDDTGDIPIVTCEQQSCKSYSAVDCGQNSSQVFDTLIMPVCVEKNISRIHHSPKSTH